MKHMKRKMFLPACSLLLCCLLLTGCVIRSADDGPQKAPYFRPPTLANETTPTHAVNNSPDLATPASTGTETADGANTPDAGQPSPTVPCKDSLTFVKDLTIPDGTEVAPESTLDKRWEIENNGNCNWGDGYRVRLIAGPELGAQKEQALFPARSSSRATIRILFKAPVDPGTYRSAWQAFNAQGEPFGDPFFIEIKVKK